MKQGKSRIALVQRPRLVGTAALAARLGISRSHLYQITRGIRRPSAALARRLRRFGVAAPLAASKEGGAE